MSLGTVEWQGNNRICITRETWAPGIWAGSEGMRLANGATIIAVDLNNRLLQIDTNAEAYETGQQLYRYIDIVSGLSHMDIQRIVDTFSYKPGYILRLTTHVTNRYEELMLAAFLGNTPDLLFSITEAVSFEACRSMDEATLKQIIFKMIVKLEETIIKSKLKYNNVTYLR